MAARTDLRLVVAVLHNDELNQVAWELLGMAGELEFLPSQELPDFPHAGHAESLGLLGIKVDHPQRWQTAGSGRWQRTVRCCWSSSPPQRCRPSRRTGPLAQIEATALSVIRGTPTLGTSAA